MTKSANASAVSVTSRLELLGLVTVRVLVTSLWLAAIAVFVFGVASTCRADCREGLADRLVDSTHEGAAGFFVSSADLECFLRTAELEADLREQLERYRERADHADARYTAMLEASARATEIIATQEEALAASIRRAVAAEDRSDAWYSSPLFWLGTDLVLGAVGFVVGLVVGGS